MSASVFDLLLYAAQIEAYENNLAPHWHTVRKNIRVPFFSKFYQNSASVSFLEVSSKVVPGIKQKLSICIHAKTHWFISYLAVLFIQEFRDDLFMSDFNHWAFGKLVCWGMWLYIQQWGSQRSMQGFQNSICVKKAHTESQAIILSTVFFDMLVSIDSFLRR